MEALQTFLRPITVSIIWFEDEPKPLEAIQVINEELKRPQCISPNLTKLIKENIIPVGPRGQLFWVKGTEDMDSKGIGFQTQKRSTGMVIVEILLELLENYFPYEPKMWDILHGVLVTFNGLSLADILDMLDEQEGRW